MFVSHAIQCAQGHTTYTHFLTANDCGATGAHQAGILISKSAWPLMFPVKPEKGVGTQENLKRIVCIQWPQWPDCKTDSVFTYYRRGTRNEFRLTKLGPASKCIRPQCTGDLFVICRLTYDLYRAWTFSTEEEISEFLDAFGMLPEDTNSIVKAGRRTEQSVYTLMEEWAHTLNDFPSTMEMAEKARELWDAFGRTDALDPDVTLVKWLQTEYDLFRYVEDFFYSEVVQYGFPDTETFLACAQTLLQRRKARAGKSFEKHLAALFREAGLSFTEQKVTELNKKPDFIFPGVEAYHKAGPEGVIVLAAKTTCKDRWRQVISEADRVQTHYLITLQQGISPMQMREMQEAHVRLVVPRSNIGAFPADWRRKLLTVSDFIELARGVCRGGCAYR